MERMTFGCQFFTLPGYIPARIESIPIRMKSISDEQNDSRSNDVHSTSNGLAICLDGIHSSLNQSHSNWRGFDSEWMISIPAPLKIIRMRMKSVLTPPPSDLEIYIPPTLWMQLVLTCTRWRESNLVKILHRVLNQSLSIKCYINHLFYIEGRVLRYLIDNIDN